MSSQEEKEESWPEPIKNKWEMIQGYREAVSEFKREKKRKIEEYKQTLNKDQPNINLDKFDIKCYEFLHNLQTRNVIPLPIDGLLYTIIEKAKDIISIPHIEQKEDNIKENSIEIDTNNDKNNTNDCTKMDDEMLIKWYQNGRRELAEYICKYIRIVEDVTIKGSFIGERRGYKGEDTEFCLDSDNPLEILECGDPTINLNDIEFDYGDDYNWEELFDIPDMSDEDVECDHKESQAHAGRETDQICFVVLKK